MEKSVDAVMKKNGNLLKVTTDVINEYGACGL